MLSTKAFKLVHVSQNANSFGLHGHVLVAQDGTGCEAARCRTTPGYDVPSGTIITFTLDVRGNPEWAKLGFEIPRDLPTYPACLVAKFWGLPDVDED